MRRKQHDNRGLTPRMNHRLQGVRARFVRVSVGICSFFLVGSVLDHTRQLFSAVLANDIAGVETLFKNGADLNAVDDSGFSLLVNALAEQELPVVDLLVSHGAEVFHNAKRCEVTILEHSDSIDRKLLDAVTANDLATVNALIQKGARVNACDGFGFSILVNALAATNNEMINFLVTNGATMRTSS